jgi:hypothetical protein
VNGDPLSFSYITLRANGPVRRGQPAAECGGRATRHAFRQRDEVVVCVSHGDKLSERTPAGKTGLELHVANLFVPALALGTRPATGNKWHRDALADKLLAHIAADRYYDASELMARDVRKDADVRIVTSPAVPIAPAQAGGFDLDDGAVVRRRGIGHRLD